MSFCTVQHKQDLTPTTPVPTNVTASDINNIVNTINTLLLPITDELSSYDSLTLSYMNGTYIGQNGATGQVVLFPNLGLKCIKMSNDPNGPWDSSPYNPLT